MDNRDRLALHPYIVVRMGCRLGSHHGAYRLARLAYGPEIVLRDLLDRFFDDCLRRAEARGKRGVSACGVYLRTSSSLGRPTCRRGCAAACHGQKRLTAGPESKLRDALHV
jgi:hypothetical protein